MKVASVCIKNFRSISSGQLECCGDFNVLIGKNNSGKSNILSAIDAFFSAIRSGDIICLDPNINSDLDFYNKDFESPAEVILSFSLSKAEATKLIADIVEDSPQMTNAVSDLATDLQLNVRIVFHLKPRSYACVNRITITPLIDTDDTKGSAEKIILDVNRDAAARLEANYRQYQQDEGRASGIRTLLRSIDRDEWVRFRRDERDNIQFRRFLARSVTRAHIDESTLELVQTTMRETSTYEDFKSALEAELETIIRYTKDAGKNELEQETVETFAGIEKIIPDHVLKLLQSLSEVNVLNVSVDRRPIGREEAQMLLNLKMQRGGQEPLRKIQETVRALLGVQIDAFAGDQRAYTREAVAELDVDDFVVEVNGSGIKEALRLLLDIEFQTPEVLLVEEPEMHLHPALETTMMRYLKEVSKDRQVFITTHSTNFLDTAEMKNIFLVSKTESTVAQLLGRGEIEERVPMELGIRLSSLFIYDRLVFVESQTDEDILRAWAGTLGVNFEQASVGFIHMGGARNIAYFSSGSTLSFLSKRGVRMWFLIDRDEKDEETINNIKKILGDDVDTSVLKKREIENYLIYPSILAQQIAFMLNKNGSNNKAQPRVEDIAKFIDKSAEELKKITILKRVAKTVCHPLYPERSRWLEEIEDKTVEEKIAEQIDRWESRLDELKCLIATETERQRKEVDDQWHDHKLDIVEGDLLIDMVFRNYNLRFLKQRDDGVELARRMSEEQIDPEIKKLIRRIVDLGRLNKGSGQMISSVNV